MLLNAETLCNNQETWHISHMTKRLAVASLSVAGLAYLFEPLPVLVGFVVVIAGPISWATWKSHISPECGKISHSDAD